MRLHRVILIRVDTVIYVSHQSLLVIFVCCGLLFHYLCCARIALYCALHYKALPKISYFGELIIFKTLAFLRVELLVLLCTFTLGFVSIVAAFFTAATNRLGSCLVCECVECIWLV